MSHKSRHHPFYSLPIQRYKMVNFSFLFLLLFCIYTVQESNESVVQVLDPVLQLPPLNHKYWSLSYSYPLYHTYSSLSNSYLHYITSTGPCPKITPPLYNKDWSPPLYHKYWNLSYSYLPYITSTGPRVTVTSPVSQALVPVLPVYPLYHKYWILSHRYFPYITSTGPCPTVTSLYHKYWTLTYRYIPYITNTGPCPTGTSPKSQVLDCPAVTSPTSQVLVSILPVHPLYHKYSSLLYSYLICITSTGHCPTAVHYFHSAVPLPSGTSPTSQVLIPVPQKPPIYHKNWTLSYWYILYITSTGPYPTVTALISQLLVLVLPVYPLYHKYWTLSYSYLSYITSTARQLSDFRTTIV